MGSISEKLFLALFGLVVFVSQSAEAITINGQEYAQLLSLETTHDMRLGYWTDMRKFYTYYEGHANAPIDVNIVGLSERLGNTSIESFYLMGRTSSPTFDADIHSATMAFYDAQGRVLLEAQLSEPRAGYLDSYHRVGPEGQLDVSGLFTMTGGEWFNSGVLQGSLYLEAFFNSTPGTYERDIFGVDADIRLYAQSIGGGTEEPPTEVPEPTAAALLAAGLLGLRARKRTV